MTGQWHLTALSQLTHPDQVKMLSFFHKTSRKYWFLANYIVPVPFPFMYVDMCTVLCHCISQYKTLFEGELIISFNSTSVFSVLEKNLYSSLPFGQPRLRICLPEAISHLPGF